MKLFGSAVRSLGVVGHEALGGDDCILYHSSFVRLFMYLLLCLPMDSVRFSPVAEV